MRKDQRYKIRWTAMMAAAVLLFCSTRALAVEDVALPLEVMREDVVALELPTIDEGEISVFDFVLDPQKLLYATGAARLGGGTVEEEATLLFRNSEGQYDFSKYSDQLTVTNRSTVPVRLTISACIEDLGEMQVVESDDFTDSEDCSIYMAVVDSQGNVLPLSADGEVSVSFEMQAAPGNAYVYRLNEELQTYQLEMSQALDKIDFDEYSFGLVGACNPNANWQNISVHPVVTVTWRVEPMMPEQEVLSAEKREVLQSSDALEEKDASAVEEKPAIEDETVTEDDPVIDDTQEPSADENGSDDAAMKNTVSGNL